ncbi:MAG TPA: GNAT family N-acetyltransferase [Pseudolabrys sp.]|nr:GNAT family N-acetyltransferase [Pseudolabrys sp.]
MSNPGLKRLQIRAAREQDLPDLLTLEQRAFESDQLSRRSFKRFLAGNGSTLIVATHDKVFAGYALVLFRPRCSIARLYSLAVCDHAAGNGIGRALLSAAEAAARKRRCKVMRFAAPAKQPVIAVRCRKFGFAELAGRAGQKPATMQFEKSLYALAGAQA